MADSERDPRWNREQLKLAFYLYCQTPFGKLHHRNPEIIKLAERIGRTPSAVAMKLTNLASLDPSITSTGRVGLKGASALDRDVWDEFHADWERLAVECERILRRPLRGEAVVRETTLDDDMGDFTGETRVALVEQRKKQDFFRKAVLSSYRGRCCMSGVGDERLLVASHIVPWSKDKRNRLNPSNGLCLSAIHDRAFDTGLITLSDDCRVLLSKELRRRRNEFVERVFVPIDNEPIETPERFAPAIEFIRYHRKHIFAGG